MLGPGGKLSKVRLPILTSRLSLRLVEFRDVPRLLRYVNDPVVFRPIATRHDPFRKKDEIAFVRNSRRSASRGEKLNLSITLKESGELIGGVGLEIRDWENGRGWIGYWLRPEFWHQAFASEAASAMCELAFERLHLHRIDAAVFDFNPRSMRLLRRLGFRKEGGRREVVYRAGRWHSETEFGLLSSEFRPFRPRRG